MLPTRRCTTTFEASQSSSCKNVTSVFGIFPLDADATASQVCGAVPEFSFRRKGAVRWVSCSVCIVRVSRCAKSMRAPDAEERSDGDAVVFVGQQLQTCNDQRRAQCLAPPPPAGCGGGVSLRALQSGGQIATANGFSTVRRSVVFLRSTSHTLANTRARRAFARKPPPPTATGAPHAIGAKHN